MKKLAINNRILAALLAAVLALSCLAACGNTAASVVKRSEGSNRGTGFHTGL